MTKKAETKIYRSEIAAAVHEMIKGFVASGVIDQQTMRAFDADCLASAEPLPDQSQSSISRV